MKDFHLIWKRRFDIEDLGLFNTYEGHEAFVGQQEANASARFREATNQGAIAIHSVVRSVPMPPSRSHEPPFVSQSRAQFHPPVPVSSPGGLSEEQMARAVELGVDRALSKLSDKIERLTQAFERAAEGFAYQPVRAPREMPREPKAPRQHRETSPASVVSRRALPEPVMAPVISFHGTELNAIQQETGSSGDLLSSAKRLKAMKKDAG